MPNITPGNGIDAETKTLLLDSARERFLRYVTIDTRSDPDSNATPSTPGQLDLARVLAAELKELGLADVTLDSQGYVYAVLPASPGANEPAITFCAHMDTSPSECGQGVQPVRHQNYDGGQIRFAADPDLVLDPDDSPELRGFVGDTIITASGDTLLGADNKAGLAAIMAALTALRKFSHLPHPELRIVFTPDEEIGRGADHIDLKRLGRYGYTIDGGMVGELEAECFNAQKATVTVKGRNIHPGYAKNRMRNAAAIAARLVAALPEHDTPEHTEKREGFWHLTDLGGDENRATAKMILRDFDAEANRQRGALLQQLAAHFETRYPGVQIGVELTQQYRNMAEVLDQHPMVTALAREAIEAAGLAVIQRPIRGGTDGARFSFLGMPTPNIFTGGMMFHSRTEWIPETALGKTAEVILHLSRLWARAGESAVHG